MKLPLNFYIITTTIVLLTLVVLGAMQVSYLWIYPLTMFGQILFLYMVYKVLTDDYETDKTFDDFYEDYPIGREERLR